MSRNAFITIGKGYKTVTCAQTGEEVTRRKSLAINYKGDGRCGNPASACERVKRALAPKPVVIAAVTTPEKKVKLQQKVKIAAKPLSTREKVQIKKLLDKKRNEKA